MKLITTAIFCLTILINTNAQEVVSNSGNSYSNDKVEISWTLGETVIKTAQSVDNELTQGFHQSNLVITAIEENIQDICSIKAFPNPTSDLIYLQLDNLEKSDLCFSLLNTEGRILIKKVIETQQTQIQMQNYATGTYFLQVRENNDVVKAFKIIKN